MPHIYNMTKQLNIAAKLQRGKNLYFSFYKPEELLFHIIFQHSLVGYFVCYLFSLVIFQAQSMTFIFGTGHMDYVMEKLYNLSESLFYFVLPWFQLFIVN